ncbi:MULTISPECIES: ATP-binding protein [Butyricimonas]|uniref:ATP-binding protein n=1 Tax=Butyricimonas TaxID=574697 RepID=UPI001D07B3CD|nr:MULTISPECIES: AAA family ATPase [Butyricimonas]MCB6973806.1 AAA family ATPase [Butyricimonas synergistica]MCG4520617.1 AAA family ATPase [Butyricimonas sp. DFI.6.44]
MFKRDILTALKQWMNDSHRKPLVLRGARQVGKTTLIHQFGEEFDNYLYLNLEKKEAGDIFELPLPLKDLLPLIFAHCGKTRKEGHTLLFIDEIQNSAKAVSLLRYFYEELPEIHVIAAGSLLENIVDIHTSFPVGRVEYLALHPCSFREFLRATGNETLLTVLEHTEATTAFHDRLMTLFNIYTLIGGMPEVVQLYAERKDILSLNNIYETLLQGYRDDVEKYTRGKQLPEVVRFLLKEGWSMAGQTITLGRFAGSTYSAREIGEAFRLLEKAMLTELVYPTTSTEVPAIPEQKRMPKLIWLDTGLVNYAAQVQKEILGSKDILDAWRGNIAEHVVAQELLTLTNKVSQRRNFWTRSKSESPAEVDFIWIQDSMIYPIEVKSGHNAHLRSLHSFLDRSPQTMAIRVWSQPYSIDTIQTPNGKTGKLINLPFYLVGQLPNIIEKESLSQK